MGANGKIQIFHYGTGEVTDLYVNVTEADWTRLYRLGEYVCEVLLDRVCVGQLMETWTDEDLTRNVLVRDTTLNGMCWGLTKDWDRLEFRVQESLIGCS